MYGHSQMFKGSTTMNSELIKSLRYLKSCFSLYGKIEESFLFLCSIHPLSGNTYFYMQGFTYWEDWERGVPHQLKICSPSLNLEKSSPPNFYLPHQKSIPRTK